VAKEGVERPGVIRTARQHVSFEETEVTCLSIKLCFRSKSFIQLSSVALQSVHFEIPKENMFHAWRILLETGGRSVHVAAHPYVIGWHVVQIARSLTTRASLRFVYVAYADDDRIGGCAVLDHIRHPALSARFELSIGPL
jgi:hypothetical protein